MKLNKKISMLLAALLALLLVVTACKGPTPPPAEEKAPVLTITSALTVSITTEETYTLAYTATDAEGGVAVAVSKSGAATTDGTYNATAGTFSATVAGVYTLTVTATNVQKTDVKTVTVTVTEPPIPTAAPTLTFVNQAASYSGAVNANITLPKATAANYLGEDISADLEVAPVDNRGVSLTKNANLTYTLVALVAGVHKISYYVEDDYGDDEQFIDVTVTPLTTETALTAAENNIANLNTSALVYKENFAKGYGSDLVQGLNGGSVVTSILGGADAIAGNSLLLDYTNCGATTNTSVWFTGLDSYIKSGRWIIEFDAKILEGKIPDFYVSFIQDGDASGDNKSYSVSTDGSVTHISYNALKTFDLSAPWHFRMFTYTGNGAFQYEGLKLVLDNFSFTWKEAGASIVPRYDGIEVTNVMLDAAGGKTLTGAEGNYSQLEGSGAPVWVQIDQLANDDLLTTEQVANLSAANGFNSPYAVKIASQLNFLTALNNLFTDPLYNYTLTAKVYAPAAAGWMLFIVNGSGGQAYANATGVGSAAGAKTWTHTLRGSASYAKIGFYLSGNSDTFLGDITVSRSLAPVSAEIQRTNSSKTITAQDLAAAGAAGITLDGKDGNYSIIETASATNSRWVEINKLTGEQVLTAEQVANMTPANGFNSPYAIELINQSTWLLSLADLCTDSDYEYIITLCVYAPAGSGGWVSHFASGHVPDFVRGGTAGNGIGVATWTTTVKGSATYAKIGYYRNGANSVFVGDINIVRRLATPAAPTTPNGKKVGDTWTLAPSDLQHNGTVIAKSAATHEAVASSTDGAFADAANVRYYSVAKDTTELFNGKFESVGTYKVTVYYYIISVGGGNQLYFQLDGGGFSAIADGHTPGYHEATITGVAGATNFFSLHTPGRTSAFEFYIAKVVIELTAIA
ncbi:MAG: hypothetical protein LBM78_01495 [Clostridiales bacterium]|jgi:hypothetical protein|nr:hypothetical protein [Clostridiales bacterium]